MLPKVARVLAAPALVVAVVYGSVAALNGLPVVLWTDACLGLLALGVYALALHARSRPPLRAVWGRVFRRPLTVVAALVLAAYALVGLLDSVHFRPAEPGPENTASATRYSSQVLSLLDVALAPLRTRAEKSYSAPLATHAYVKESIERDGGVDRVHVRLRHGGSHLADPADRHADVTRSLIRAALLALSATGLAGAVLVLALARSRGEPLRPTLARLLAGAHAFPWRTGLAALAGLLFVVFGLALLASGYHVLGTDKVGQDVLYQTLKSVRTGIVIGTVSSLVMLPFAITLGLAAGYFRGWVDDVVQYAYTVLNSIPAVLLIAAAVLTLQIQMTNHPQLADSSVARADLRLFFLCLILGLTSWTNLCRLLRAETLKLSELDYVQAAITLGTRPARILARHILPNAMHIVLITVVLDFSTLVLAEAVLSYVGVGVDPTMESWGNMINSARLELAREPLVWWSVAAAFAFMFVLVLAANLFADAVRDAFDPRLRDQ